MIEVNSTDALQQLLKSNLEWKVAYAAFNNCSNLGTQGVFAGWLPITVIMQYSITSGLDPDWHVIQSRCGARVRFLRITCVDIGLINWSH